RARAFRVPASHLPRVSQQLSIQWAPAEWWAIEVLPPKWPRAVRQVPIERPPARAHVSRALEPPRPLAGRWGGVEPNECSLRWLPATLISQLFSSTLPVVKPREIGSPTASQRSPRNR